MTTSDTLHIYTDGSCPVQRGPGGWAFVVLGTPNIYESGFCPGPETNNTMELTAVLEALRFIRDESAWDRRIVIHADSTYVINGMISGWRHVEAETDFRFAVNGDLWRRLHYHAEHIRKLRFVHVKGHAGDTWNEQADRMAARAVREGKRFTRGVV